MAFVFAMSIGWCHLPMLEIQKVESLYPLCFYLAGTLFIIAVSVFYGKMNMFIAGVPFVLYVGYVVQDIGTLLSF